MFGLNYVYSGLFVAILGFHERLLNPSSGLNSENMGMLPIKFAVGSSHVCFQVLATPKHVRCPSLVDGFRILVGYIVILFIHVLLKCYIIYLLILNSICEAAMEEDFPYSVQEKTHRSIFKKHSETLQCVPYGYLT